MGHCQLLASHDPFRHSIMIKANSLPLVLLRPGMVLAVEFKDNKLLT